MGGAHVGGDGAVVVLSVAFAVLEGVAAVVAAPGLSVGVACRVCGRPAARFMALIGRPEMKVSPGSS